MSARKRINKTKFYAINRDIKIPGSAVKTIAAVHNVSEETVRTIKRAKTWPRFEAAKKLKNERRQPTQVKEAVNPQLALVTPEKQLDEITQAPENQIRPLPSEGPASEIKVLTVKEWEDMNRKVGRLHTLVTYKRRKSLLSIFRRTK
jgi:hypothetical protein